MEKAIHVAGIPSKLWASFTGEAKKRQLKVKVALVEAIKEWLKND